MTDIRHQAPVPTLVLHVRNDAVRPLEQRQELATDIKDAQFVMLESSAMGIGRNRSTVDVVY